MLRGRAIPLGLSITAYLLALLQRSGLDSSDTKINLHVAPARFLTQVGSVWSPTQGLGHVQGGQYSGYLWPMGPFFWLGHVLGLPDWVVDRLWLGTLLALAAWGAVRLVDVLLSRQRGIAHLAAGAVYMLNPYVVVWTTRTTVFLLAYAALPWLLVVTHRGLRDPRRWWWPAAFALITTSTAGGVNATVTAYVLLGPLLLAAYELGTRAVPGRDVLALAWRTGVATAAAAAWWVIPEAIQSGYGLNFLPFTESIGAVLSSTSLSESLRLMGYWPTYLGQGYGTPLIPYFRDASTMLFNPLVVVSTLLVPGLAITGYAWTRRYRYAPFFMITALVAVLVMSAGWPGGAERSGIIFFFQHLSSLAFLRTTYKAGPLLAISVAFLGGAGLGLLWRSAGTGLRAATALACAGLVALSALPFFEGRAVELTWRAIPSAWRGAAADLDHRLPANSRALVLPGQDFAYYRWGATIDPILPALTKRPVAVRNEPPYDDLHAVDYLWTVDGLVQQQRLLAGQLPPLLDLMSARSVVTATDDDANLSGAVSPAAAAQQLAGQPGFTTPARSYGPLRTFSPAQGSADPALRLPQVRRYDVPARGLLRIEPGRAATIVDGSAGGLTDLAALGLLSSRSPILYAGDVTAGAIRREAASGGSVFITDSNQRRVFLASRVAQNTGPVLTAGEAPPAESTLLDPFPGRGTAAQTVALYTGVRYVRAPSDATVSQFPAHQPYAALDGDPATSWLADPTLAPSQQYLEVGLERPTTIPYVDLLPDTSDPLVRLTGVEIGGRSFPVHAGWNRIAVSLSRASSFRVYVNGSLAPGAGDGYGFGIAELRIPGVRATERLRPPVLAEAALRGADLRHSAISYVFERITAADPLRRSRPPAQVVVRGNRAQVEPALVAQAQDPESGLARAIDPPAARVWSVSGLATVSPTASDPVIDRLARTSTRGAILESSTRLQGVPGYRASAAFDGSATTAWVAPFGPGQPAWIEWTTPRPRTITSLTLLRSALPVRFPAAVSVQTPAAVMGPLPVSADGAVRLPHPTTSRSFRLNVISAGGSSRPAVAIAEIRGTGARSYPAPPGSPIGGACGELAARAGARTVPLRVSGSVAALDHGEALAVRGCAGPVSLPAGPLTVAVAPTAFRPLLLALRSPAPDPLATAAGGGAVLSSGDQGPGAITGVRVRAGGPAWLVLGESYSRGWEASCNGRSLGPPEVIDGFANGWRIGAGCTRVALSFGPQRAVDIGYWLGAAACAILLLVLLLRRPRGQPAPVPSVEPAREPAPDRERWGAPAAGFVALIGFAVFTAAFGAKPAVVIAAGIGLVLWRGVADRAVILFAGLLLAIAVPLLYLLFPGTDQGGYDTRYPPQHLAAHGLVAVAVGLLILVLLRGPLNTAIRRLAGARSLRRRASASPRSEA